LKFLFSPKVTRKMKKMFLARCNEHAQESYREGLPREIEDAHGASSTSGFDGVVEVTDFRESETGYIKLVLTREDDCVSGRKNSPTLQ